MEEGVFIFIKDEIYIEKKQWNCKPGSVFKPVIYLGVLSPAPSSNLPPDIRRAALHTSVYLVLQHIVRTASSCHQESGELLPRLFTLTFYGGYFLLR